MFSWLLQQSILYCIFYFIFIVSLFKSRDFTKLLHRCICCMISWGHPSKTEMFSKILLCGNPNIRLFVYTMICLYRRRYTICVIYGIFLNNILLYINILT